MGLWDIRPYSSVRGGTMSARQAPMTALGTAFLPGEVVIVAPGAGTVSIAPQDGTQLVIADGVAGVAINGPGLATATAEKPAASGYGRQYQHPDTGNTYATGDAIWFLPFGEGNLFSTRVVLAAGGAAAGAAFTGADRGAAFELTYCSGTTPDLGWGLERTAGVYGTDYVAEVMDVLDANGRAVTATGTGVTAVFRVLI